LLIAPARADYIFDPADLPKNFSCDSKWSAEKCSNEQRWEAWWNHYGDRYDHWYHGLLFNTDIYFDDVPVPAGEDAKANEEPWDPEIALGHQTRNLVDVVHSVALRRYGGGWAFAVEMVCEKSSECAPKLRMVSFRRPDEVTEDAQRGAVSLLPISREEVAAELRIIAKWEEADLRSCKGALDQLLMLPAQNGTPLWNPGYVKWLKGRAPKEKDEIIVTADGSGVLIRASGRDDPENVRALVGDVNIVYSQWNGGAGMGWALEMAEKVRPCLKPATSPAPWDRLVNQP
jgi:hypothetical protein